MTDDQVGLFDVPLEVHSDVDPVVIEADVEEAEEEERDQELVPDSRDIEQGLLFGIEEQEPWRKEWVGMPEFSQRDLTSVKSIVVHFATMGDYWEFMELIDQKGTPKTRSIWHPAAEIGHFKNKRYAVPT
jgi:hypothetical protein